MPRIAIAVHDFEATMTAFREQFGMPVLDFSSETVPDLGAHVGMCMPEGGSNIEIMAPSVPEAPLSQSLQKFLDRRGEGFYALMLEAPVPDDEAEELSARGVDVLPLMAGAGGRDIHPRSTHGVLIRVYPNDSVPNPGGLQSTAPELSGINKVIIATTDAEQAVDAYRVGLGLEAGSVDKDEERGVLTAICQAPKGGIIELVSALDTSRPFAHDIERFVDDKGQGMYALVLHADNPQTALSTLQDRGVTTGGTAGNEASIFGARFIIE